MLRVTREFIIGERNVQVLELTLGEIRAWLRDISTGGASAGDLVDALLFADFDPDALRRMTGMTSEQLDAFTPSELHQVAAACREVNPDFFAMRQRMVETQHQLLARLSSAPA